MTHDCKLRRIETFEDEEGKLFIKEVCGLPFDSIRIHPVEYCPICGTKSIKSHIDYLTMFDRKK